MSDEGLSYRRTAFVSIFVFKLKKMLGNFETILFLLSASRQCVQKMNVMKPHKKQWGAKSCNKLQIFYYGVIIHF